MQKKVIVITGPTAAGKSALAVETALRFHTEVISADSRQIYAGIPIATAAPTAEMLSIVPHHLVGTLALQDYYSAALFEQDALRIARALLDRNGVAVVCGGSMLYVDAFCRGIDDLPDVPQSIRTELMEEHAIKGDQWLLAELLRLDPSYYGKVDRRNIARVRHAVEIIRASGSKYTLLRTGKSATRDFDIELKYVDLPRPELFSRISHRVDEMIIDGLEEEARSVYHLRSLNSLQTVGLKEMFAYFDGGMGLDEAIDKIKKNTRDYAKKQIAWWRRRKDS